MKKGLEGLWNNWLKKHPLIASGITIFTFLFFWLCLHNEVKSFFDKSGTEVAASVDTAFTALFQKTEEDTKKISKKIDGLKVVPEIDCSKLEQDWDAGDSLSITGQYLVLPESELAGSAHFSDSFSNMFALNFKFRPSTLSGTDVTTSIKDEAGNELSITLGESSLVKTSYKPKAGSSVSATSSVVRLYPIINPEKEISLRVQSVWEPKTVRITGFLAYSSKDNSEMSPIWVPLVDWVLPQSYLESDNANLNLGLETKPSKSEKNIRLINCSIKEELPS